MAYQIDFGKYRNKHATVEDLFFIDPQYLFWIKNTFEPEGYLVGYIKQLEEKTKAIPVVSACGAFFPEMKRCEKKPTLIGVPEWNDILYTKYLQFSCTQCRAKPELWDDFHCILWYDLSFAGLENFIVERKPHRHQVEAFARKLAEAWGILDTHGWLTKSNIRTFFEQLQQ
jgi:hypothetical protein